MDTPKAIDRGQPTTGPTSAPPAQPSYNRCRLFIVAGPVVPETIHLPSRRTTYTTVGGVGAQLASALNGPQSHAALLAAVPRTREAQTAAGILVDQGIEVIAHPADHGSTQLVFGLDGEIIEARGFWPPTPALDQNFVRLLKEAHFLLIASEPEPDDIEAYLSMARGHRVPTMVVVSATQKLDNLLAISQRPKTVVAMNHFEFAQAARTSGAKDPTSFMRTQNTKALFVTHAEAGWTLHRPNRPDLKIPAPPAPANALFLGCGDWAAAALAQALAAGMNDRSLAAHVNRSIIRKLAQNAAAADAHASAAAQPANAHPQNEKETT